MRWDFKFKREPNFEYFLKVIRRENRAEPVPIIELSADLEVMEEICGGEKRIERKYLSYDLDLGSEKVKAYLQWHDLRLEFAQKMGFDFVSVSPIVPMMMPNYLPADDFGSLSQKRGWQDEHKGIIASWEDLERYLWPEKEQISLLPLDYLAEKLPHGMKECGLVMGIFEAIRWLMGFENFAIACVEEVELVEEILERLTILTESIVELCARHPAVGAIFYPDDLGFKSQTMVSPSLIRKLVIPRQKRIAEACHKHGKPFIFHSCGKIEAVIEEEIETVRIDGWHAFQDNILPVESAYQKYHPRVAILGGVDMDLLARASPEQVRARVREILEVCGYEGGFCLGSGNSFANYLPFENYQAMLEECQRWNREVLKFKDY